ncbi:hypothetical protein E2542_SST02131 [Spatholobus suberectus]|nr:hypothetical protein E2542_SST02131 [Spatholobus suberectus]
MVSFSWGCFGSKTLFTFSLLLHSGYEQQEIGDKTNILRHTTFSSLLQTEKAFVPPKFPKDMSFLTFRGFFFLVCVGILASQPCMVSGLRSKDLALRWDSRQSPLVQMVRILKTVAMEDLQSQLDLAPAPSMTFDPNQSNKRTVRKGSDPIHNRS